MQRNYIYVGLTANIKRRMSDHNSGRNRTTKPYAPFELIYTEQLANRMIARQREIFLKSGAGKEFLKSIK